MYVNKDAAENALEELKFKWSDNYLIVTKDWRDNRDRLTAYFQYSQYINTTNTVEGYRCQLRMVTRNKGVFTFDIALEILSILYLQESERSGFNRLKTGIRQHSDWRSRSRTDLGLYPDCLF